MTPEHLTEIIGEDAAFSLITLRGGLNRFYVPHSLTDRIICECGGDPLVAKRLCDSFGGQFIALPIARRWRISIMRRRGLSVRDITLSLGVTAACVERALISETRCRDEQRGPLVA